MIANSQLFFFWFRYCQFSWLIWEYSNSLSLWYLHLKADKIQSDSPIIMTTFLLDIPCSQKDFSTELFLQENWREHSTNLWLDIQNFHQSSTRVHHQWYVIVFQWLNYTIPSLTWWNSHRCQVLCTRKGILTPPDTWCHHWLISRDVPMTNIRRAPCGGWMIILFMVVSFVIGCGCLSECVFIFFIIAFGLVVMDFCLWEIRFSGQMINGTVSWLLGLDRIFKWSYDYFNGET